MCRGVTAVLPIVSFVPARLSIMLAPVTPARPVTVPADAGDETQLNVGGPQA